MNEHLVYQVFSETKNHLNLAEYTLIAEFRYRQDRDDFLNCLALKYPEMNFLPRDNV